MMPLPTPRWRNVLNPRLGAWIISVWPVLYSVRGAIFLFLVGLLVTALVIK